jgi:hypothetical protein
LTEAEKVRQFLPAGKVKEGLEFALNVFRMTEQDVVKWLCEQPARFAELKEWLPSDHAHFCVEKFVLEGTSWREVDVKWAMKGISALHFRNCVGFVKNLSVKGVVQSLGCVATFLTEEKLTSEQQQDFVAQTCKLISHLFALKVGSVGPVESDAFSMDVTHPGWKETLRTCLRHHLSRRNKSGPGPPDFINKLAAQLFTPEEMPKAKEDDVVTTPKQEETGSGEKAKEPEPQKSKRQGPEATPWPDDDCELALDDKVVLSAKKRQGKVGWSTSHCLEVDGFFEGEDQDDHRPDEGRTADRGQEGGEERGDGIGDSEEESRRSEAFVRKYLVTLCSVQLR